MESNITSLVGETHIYSEQRKAGEEILKIFGGLAGPPLLVAQPQQGKTGVAIYVAEQLYKDAKAKGKTFEFIYLINVGDNDLKNQTETRLMKSGFLLGSTVFVEHQNNLAKIKIDPNTDTTFIVVDECHVALTKHKLFHNFLKENGVRYGLSTNSWGGAQKKIYILSLSATPFAQMVRKKINDGSFAPVILEQSNKYLSLNDVYNKGRIKQSQKLHDNTVTTQFLRERVDEFYNTYKETIETKHLIIRSKGKGPSIISDYINQQYPKVFEIKIVDQCSKQPSIASLNDYLSNDYKQNSSKLFITIIKGALRVGKTLDTVKHIGMWIDSPDATDDTMIQSVGRLFGFEDSRKLALFPIYANIKHIENAISFYKNPLGDIIPAGYNNSRTKENNGYGIGGFYSSVKEAEKTIGKVKRTARVSKREDAVLYDIIFDGVYRGTSTTKSTNGYLVYADGIETAKKQINIRGNDWFEKVEKGYKKFDSDYPEFSTKKYIHIKPGIKTKIIGEINPNSMLKNP
jgi:hypothetical protein